MALRKTPTGRKVITLVTYLLGVCIVAFGGWFALVRPRWGSLETVDWIDLALVLGGQIVFAVRMLCNHDWRPPDDADEDIRPPVVKP